jgi:hypothetical protein
MARRRRSFMGLETVPGLSGITDSFKGSVKGTDVVIGVAAFLGVHYLVKWGLNKLTLGGTKIPDLVIRFTPLVTAAVVAVAMPFAGKKLLKLNPAKVSGLVVGAIGAGVAVVALQEAKAAFPVLADYNDLRLSGMILNDPALQGLLLEDARTAQPYGDFDAAPNYTQTNFAALAAAGGDEESDFDY